MLKGTTEITFLGFAFLSLQIWWLSMTIKNKANEKVISNQSQLDAIKKNLDETFNK